MIVRPLRRIYEWYTSLRTYTYSTAHTAASQNNNSLDCDDQFEKGKIHCYQSFLYGAIHSLCLLSSF